MKREERSRSASYGDSIRISPASLFKADLKTAFAGGDRALLGLVMATHTGMTTVEFEQIVLR